MPKDTFKKQRTCSKPTDSKCTLVQEKCTLVQERK